MKTTAITLDTLSLRSFKQRKDSHQLRKLRQGDKIKEWNKV